MKHNIRSVIAVIIIIVVALFLIIQYSHWSYVYQSKENMPLSKACDTVLEILANHEEKQKVPKDLFVYNVDEILDEIVKTSPDGSYDDLLWSFKRFEFCSVDSSFYAEIQFNESRSKFTSVDSSLSKLIEDSNILAADPKEERIKKICNYLKDNYKYDDTLESDTISGMLGNGKYTCKSISLLAFKVFRKTGIKCRLIAGTYLDEPHAWVQVYVNNVWKNLDLTLWIENNEFYLVRSSEMPNHKIDNRYKSRFID